MDQLDLTMSRPQVPLPIPAETSNGEQWMVTVVDEGPTVMGIGHTRHGFEPDFEPYIAQQLEEGIALEQLTPAKLDQLLDRWSGNEWLAAGFRHLDRAVAERADVARGLHVYCGTSPSHAAHFADLYATLPDDRRLLPDELVDDLSRTATPATES